ncbi:MAG: DUF2058 domain-containing protein [Pontibacterium sp.]
MAGSLQDQLLNIGVVDKKKAKQAQQQKRQSAKKNKQARKSGQKIEVENTQAQLDQAKLEKQQRDLELNKQRDAERAHKALFSEVRQIILQHAVEMPKDAEVAYNFVQDKKIKKLYITAEQQTQLIRGQLAIAIIDESHRLIPDKMAEKIEMRLPEMVIRIQPEEAPDEDDPYADYQIPDDLMW